VIHSNSNLGIHGQGVLNLSGNGDTIEAERLILSLFYNIVVHQSAFGLFVYLYKVFTIWLCLAQLYGLQLYLEVW
jgi:hypothetical protein